jgi:hypothetical protein
MIYNEGKLLQAQREMRRHPPTEEVLNRHGSMTTVAGSIGGSFDVAVQQCDLYI